MSYKFGIESKKLYILYSPEFETAWLRRLLKIEEFHTLEDDDSSNGDTVNIRRTFHIPIENYESNYFEQREYDEGDETFVFFIGEETKDERYYKISKDIVGVDYDLYVAADINLDAKFFGRNNISVFKEINRVYKNDKLYVDKTLIDNPDQNHIIENDIRLLSNQIPNDYEMDLYKKNRISSLIEDTLNVESFKPKLEAYISKKDHSSSGKVDETFFELVELDIRKFQYLQRKLIQMLVNPAKYLEADWQKEILDIFRFIYPQYIHVEEKLVLQSYFDGKKLETDIVLIDTDGNIDLIEIKRPDEFLQYKTDYRGNYIPSKNLIGTCMQLQNYLNCLIKTPQKDLEKFREDKGLSNELLLKANSPKGYIIFGRDEYIASEEKRKHDFFTTRRMFSHIIDVITYDDMLRRLDNIISSLENKL